MRKLLMTAVLAGVTMLSPGLSPQARASHDWLSIGTVFRVGAAHIAFALGRPFGYEPAYYYRYDQPVHYRGHSCSRSCFHDAGYYYHHESCPLVAAHFSHYRVDPRRAFDRYAPRYSGYDRYDRYDRHDRRDRYDRSDRYDRYDRNDRYGRHDRCDRHDRDRYDRSDRYDRHDRYDRDDRYRSRRDRDRRHSHRHYDGCGH